MIRKTMLALTATVAVAAAAMVPTAASAWHHHHHHHGFHGARAFGWGVAIAAPVVATCYQYRWVETRRGVRRMLVNVCAY
jgi:hypothetical protein